MVAAAADASPAVARLRGHRFVFGFVLLLAALVTAGFGLAAFNPIVPRAGGPPASVVLHGVLFFGWLALVLTQVALIATRNIRWHKRFGAAGAALAVAMLAVGGVVAVNFVAREIAAGRVIEGKAFLLTPTLDLLLFATFTGIALAWRHKSDLHKRLMLLATLALTGAGTFRLLFLLDQSGWLATVVTDALLILPMLHDRRTRGHVHPVYWLGGAALVAVHVAELTLGGTAVWQAIATMIVG